MKPLLTTASLNDDAFATPPPFRAVRARDEPMISAARESSGRDLEREEEEEEALRAARADLVSLAAEEVLVVAIVRRRRYNQSGWVLVVR